MQPYFFPYLGYFGLIAATDRWIVFDPVAYAHKSWMRRNRVLKKGGGEKYVALSIAPHARGTSIKDIRLNPDPHRFDAFVRELDAYERRRAPHRERVLDLLRDCFDSDAEHLVPFSVRCLERTCAYLGIRLQYEIYSEMGLDHATPLHPMEWSLYICKALGASQYVNPPGGRTFFDPGRFAAEGVSLRFYEQQLPPYAQGRGDFVPGLSIIDVMMFNTPEEIRAMLAQHELCER